MTRISLKRSDDRKPTGVLLAAVVVALVAVGTAAAVTTRAAVAPTNNSLPTISGSFTAGSTITANPGTWSGSAPITFQYQWRICDDKGAACHDIAGATSQTYLLKNDDTGNTVRLEVIASNSDGSRTETSVPSARIAAAGTGPTNTTAPTITGTAATGATLTANPGNWSGPAPITFTFVWTICDENGSACHDITGATNNTYVVKSDDAGNTIRLRVTAKNSTGTTDATTAATARLTAGGGGSAGCAPGSAGTTVPIANVAAPARLQVKQFQVTSGALKMSSTSFTAKFQITDTCGHPVSGALVDAAAVPYNQFAGKKNAATDSAGWVSLSFNRQAGYPASSKQRQLTMFVLAHKTGEPALAGVSTRRLISFRIGR